jgi:hypothetical protein
MRLCVGLPKAQGILVGYVAGFLVVLNELDLVWEELSVTVDVVEVCVE